MKDLGMEIHQIVGVTDGTCWSQVRLALPFGKEELIKGGGIVAVMSLNNGDSESVEKGGNWLEEIVDSFQSKTEEDRHVWLKKTLGTMEGKMSGLGSLVLVAIQENLESKSLVIGGIGHKVMVGMKRDGKVGRLWTGALGKIVSGELKEDDEVIVGTEKFWVDVWGKISGNDMEEKLEQARLLTINQPAGGEISGVVIRITHGQENDEMNQQDELTNLISSEVETKSLISETVISNRGKRRDFKEWIGKWNKGIRLGGSEKKSISGVFLLVVMLVLSVSVATGWWQRQRTIEESSYKKVAEPIEHVLEEAKSLKELNPQRARSLVVEARQNLEARKNDYKEGRFAKKWDNLTKSAETIWKEVSGEKEVVGELWLDLGVIREGMVPDEIVKVDDQIMVLDKKTGVIVKVDLNDKSGDMIAGGGLLVNAKKMGGNGDRIFVLTDDGVVKVDIKKKSEEKILSKDESFGSPVDIDGFGTNIYLLDDKELWKYPGTENEVGARRRYFGVGIEPDLSQAKDLEVDGEVWILLASNQVLRFDRGSKVDFQIKNIIDDFGSVDDLVIGEEEIFVLDKNKARVIVFEKSSGDYKKELKWDGFKSVSSLIVDEKTGRLLMGKDGKIFEVKW